MCKERFALHTHMHFALCGALLCTNDTGRCALHTHMRFPALHGALLCTNDTRALSSSAWHFALHE